MRPPVGAVKNRWPTTDGRDYSTCRAYRRTIFEADRWVHVAWVWGPREDLLAVHKEKAILTATVYVDGRRGMAEAYKLPGNSPCFAPTVFSVGSEFEGAIDELRISDAQRYTDDFAPCRDRELTVDEHTRALFHFNGNTDGRSHGWSGPLPVTLRN